jgi:DNA-binding NtrC family response regulator
MARPTVLIVEPDPGAALSTRKLVIETAKFNVLTAHSATEGAELFRLFPAIDAVIVTTSVSEQAAGDLLQTVKQINPAMTTVLISHSQVHLPQGADYHSPSFEPEQLVSLLRSLFGDPRAPFVKTGAAATRQR